MCRVASQLANVGHEVIIFDGQMLRENNDSLASRVQEWGSDLILIGCFPELHLHTFMGISAFPYDLECAFHLHDIRPSCPIYLGGYIPSLFPEQTIQTAPFTNGIIRSLQDILQVLDNGPELGNGDCFYDICSGYDYLVPDIRNYGIDRSLYLDPTNLDIKPTLPILTSLGCPHKCTFCATPAFFRHKYQVHSIECALDEIENGVKKYGVNQWSVWDDTFTVNSARVQSFCHGLLEREIDISWWCFGHAGWIVRNQDKIKQLRQAGCKMMWVGIESVDENSLTSYQKGTNPGEGLQAIEILLENDILPTTSFLVGELDDDKQSLNRRLKSSERYKQLGCVNIYTLLIPVPGTYLFTQLFNGNKIVNHDLRLYSGVRSVVKYNDLSPDNLEEIFFSAYVSSILSNRWLNAHGRINHPKEKITENHDTTNKSEQLLKLAKKEFERLKNLENESGSMVDVCRFAR